MAAAYRVVVSSVSCYNSVVVDRRAHSQAVHYCAGPCGALSQGLDCTVAHRGTCSEFLVAPDATFNDFNSSPIQPRNMISPHLPNHNKLCISMDTIHNGGLERAGSSDNLSLGEVSPTWRGKKTSSGTGSIGNLSCSGSLKDITEEAINLASGKLKEFSFDKLRLSSSSHVTLRKGRKVRPDSFSRRSTDLEIIYGHFSSSLTANTATNSMTNGIITSNDENVPPFMLGKGNGAEEAKLKGSSGSLSATTKVGNGSTSSLSSIGSLDQSLNTVASLYRTTLGEENLIARLLEKTRAEAGSGGAGGEDIRACLDILLKCSEDLKKCTDIIKQCIRRKAGGGPEDGGTNPDSVYRAVMTRLSSYLKRLPLELEGVGSLGGTGQGGQGTPGRSSGYIPTWPSSTSLTVSTPKATSHRNDDIDKLLMDLENLSQSMSHPRTTEPPLPAKTRKRGGAQAVISNESLTQARMAQYQVQKPASHLAMNGVNSRVTQSPTPPQGENSEPGTGDEEDGALLLRILESIESFAQELVDSGAGSSDSAERKVGKEKEVMRLLQDTLVTAGRAETPDNTTPPVVPTAPSTHTAIVQPVASNHTQENPPKVLSALAFISAASEVACNAAVESEPRTTSDADPENLSKSVPDETTETPTVEVRSESPPASGAYTAGNLQDCTLEDEPAPAVSVEEPSSVAISATEDAVIADGEPLASTNTGSTLLIQQTPEVIRKIPVNLHDDKDASRSHSKARPHPERRDVAAVTPRVESFLNVPSTHRLSASFVKGTDRTPHTDLTVFTAKLVSGPGRAGPGRLGYTICQSDRKRAHSCLAASVGAHS
ncbi:hypothetical protein CCH79_00008022 [Gambusia affinis]|uniref:Uncharacterized protein n=1 Tax=Gambusia affinis TaxID=33528 RepID=A0A315W4A5_GAMAF|nr:hypothetical protein CCH79_00008022 [Gambusia affinis]